VGENNINREAYHQPETEGIKIVQRKATNLKHKNTIKYKSQITRQTQGEEVSEEHGIEKRCTAPTAVATH